MHEEIGSYVKSWDECQRGAPLPKNYSNLWTPVSSHFDIISIAFAGPFPPKNSGNHFILV